MIARTSETETPDLAERSFQVITQILLTLPQAPRRGDAELKDMEFFTLSLLQQRQTMIVGEIQKILGILPAQMSRIIRSLEGRERPLIQCEINPNDKRKINVRLTSEGEHALGDYLSPRLQVLQQLLNRLNTDERHDLANLLQRVTHIMESEMEEADDESDS